MTKKYRYIEPSDNINDRASLAVLFKKLAKTNGMVSIFWITANDRRASAVQNLEDVGQLVLDNGAGYPWFKVQWNGKRTTRPEPPGAASDEGKMR